MLLDDYYWHYDYARLAWDTGFCFDKYKYPNLDKNKICIIDIDRIIKERDVASIERNISTVVQYVLENDQAEVLDSNFVKLFRLGQLSVEYLLFCKKYLDKTVVLLKKDVGKLKQEIKELHLYTEELEKQISITKNLTSIYTCGVCSKMFSTEDFLNAHAKRRHSEAVGKEHLISGNTEAEKLHSEIKELKERLNNTEKIIQEKPSNQEVDNFKEIRGETEDKSAKLVSEIQESFEKFRKQVEEKMTSLQSEKNFFTDKYDKLFETVLQYKNKEQEHSHQEVRIVEGKKIIDSPKIEHSTQTDETKRAKKLQIHTVQYDNTYSFKDEEIISNNEDIDEKIERKLSNFEENIESKISSSLCNIENQIQTFWQKLSEGDLLHPLPVPEVIKTEDQPLQTELPNRFSDLDQEKPKIKPRTKLTKPTEIISKSTEHEVQVTENQHKFDEILHDSKPILQHVGVDKLDIRGIYETSSETNTESSEKSCVEQYVDKGNKPIAPTLIKIKDQQMKPNIVPVKSDRKHLVKKTDISPKKDLKIDLTNSETLKQNLHQQINDVIAAGLQEMGISVSWNGIPKKTYERALEIVKHQAVLNKKCLPEYNSLRKSIEKLLKNNKDLKQVKQKVQSSHSTFSKPNTIKIQIKKNELPTSKPIAVVDIKNRSLYDSESETDIKSYLPKNFNQEKTSDQEKAHSAVIEELQSKFTHKSADTDSDLHSSIISIEERDKKEKETKSAMKTFSSEGSLVKKKVFFDVEEFVREDNVNSELEHKTDLNKEDSLSDFEIT